MGRINEAYCKKYGRNMTFEEITADEFFDEIKDDLHCATKGCPSRITYVRGDKACLRTFRGDNHSENCDDAFEREAKAARYEKIDSAFIELTEDDFSKKQLYLLNKFINKEEKPDNTKSTGKRKKTNETKNMSNEKQEYIQGELGTGESGQTKEELKEATGAIVRGPSFPAKELNQISDQDIGSKCGIAAEIISVKRNNDKHYEIEVLQNNTKGMLILPEAFFATQYVEAETYVKSLGEYIERKLKYPLYVLTYCEVEKTTDEKLRLGVLNYVWLAVSVGKAPIKRLKLASFYALFNTGYYDK